MSDRYAGQISLDDTYVFEDGTASRLILVAEDLDSVSNILYILGAPEKVGPGKWRALQEILF